LGGLAAATVGAAGVLRPSDQGANHSDYFSGLSDALHTAGLSQPTLVIDKALLNDNIRSLSRHIGDSFDYRIVGKSLPSIPLLKTVMEGAGTRRLMMFHQPFLSQVVEALPQSDILMGKPMPVAAAATFYDNYDPAKGFDSSRQLQWLIDTPARLQQYQTLAQRLKTRMNINIELDVGLHRGGVSDDADLVALLKRIESDPLLQLSGFMGYEPHVAKLPGNKLAARDKAMAISAAQLDLAERVTGRDLSDLTLNAAGSPTYRYYAEGDFPHNELSAGSCLVKPLDFDLPTLAEHRPACFIATPVLKSSAKPQVPGVPGLGKLMALWNPNRAQSFYSYGGYWKARPESPVGLSNNPLIGHSTNQELYQGSQSINLQADDWMFLRPTQSEFVFLQFGDIAVYEDGKIVERWPVFHA